MSSLMNGPFWRCVWWWKGQCRRVGHAHHQRARGASSTPLIRLGHNCAVTLATSLSVHPLSPTIGAEISGVDIARPLAPEVVTSRPRRPEHPPRHLLPRPVPHRRPASRLRPPVRDRHGGPPGAALHRREPRGARHRRQGGPGQLVAHRRHLLGNAGDGIDPLHARGARRRRRHHVGQPAGRLRRARRTGALHVRSVDRHSPRPLVRRRRRRAWRIRVGRHVARPTAAGPPSGCTHPSRDGTQRPFRQPAIHPHHLRPVGQREWRHPRDALQPLRQAGIHLPLPLARRVGRLLGQQGHAALRAR